MDFSKKNFFIECYRMLFRKHYPLLKRLVWFCTSQLIPHGTDKLVACGISWLVRQALVKTISYFGTAGKKKKIIRFSCSQIKRTKIEIKTRFPFETEENLIVEILYTVAKNSVQLDNAVYTYEQCTTTGPSCRRLFISAITWRTNDNIEVGWAGTPWSGHDT